MFQVLYLQKLKAKLNRFQYFENFMIPTMNLPIKLMMEDHLRNSALYHQVPNDLSSYAIQFEQFHFFHFYVLQMKNQVEQLFLSDSIFVTEEPLMTSLILILIFEILNLTLQNDL